MTPATQRSYERRRAILERIGLQPEEHWPLFDVKKCLSQAGQVWVVLSGLPDLSEHPDGTRMLYRELRRLEHRIHSEGIVGWIQAIKRGNTRMRRWTEMVGAVYYSADATRWYFRKFVNARRLPISLKDLVMEGKHGHA